MWAAGSTLLHAQVDDNIHCVSSRKKLWTVAQSCLLTLCDPIDWSPPDSSVHGISQARIREWIDTSFSSESSQPRDQTSISCKSLALEAYPLPQSHCGSPMSSRSRWQMTCRQIKGESSAINHLHQK